MGIEDMGAQSSADFRHALTRHLARNAKPRDVEDFLQGGSELRRSIVAEPAFELRQDRVPRVAAHADDERKAELRCICVVEAMKTVERLVAETVEANACLLALRIVGERICASGFPRKIGMAAQELE